MENLLYNPVALKRPPGEAIEEGVLPQRSTLLFHPDKNEREYQGELRYNREEGLWQGATLWGKKGNCGSHQKIVYQGPSRNEAQISVETMLRKKVASGYRGKSENNPLLWSEKK